MRQPTTAGSIFLLDGDGSADGTRGRDPAMESAQVRVKDDAVSDFDGEFIGRIATAILRNEQKIPCAIEWRCRKREICGRAQSEQNQPKSLTSKGRSRLQFFHRILLAPTKVEVESRG
jgi:hypothetical protein